MGAVRVAESSHRRNYPLESLTCFGKSSQKCEGRAHAVSNRSQIPQIFWLGFDAVTDLCVTEMTTMREGENL
jgi:hypothetical protein